MTNIIRTLITAAIVLSACDDGNDSPTTSATAATTGTLPPVTTSTGDTDDTTSSSSGDEPTTSTTDDTTGVPPLTTGTQEPLQCVPQEVLDCAATFPTWCEEVGDLARQHFDDTYADIVQANCEVGAEPCTLCFAVSNYCTQVGHDCGEGTDLFIHCGCLAQAHEVL